MVGQTTRNHTSQAKQATRRKAKPCACHSRSRSRAGKASNGETSKSRKFVAEADCYDDLVAWLDWEFHKNDINKDGYLDYHEFVK